LPKPISKEGRFYNLGLPHLIINYLAHGNKEKLYVQIYNRLPDIIINLPIYGIAKQREF